MSYLREMFGHSHSRRKHKLMKSIAIILLFFALQTVYAQQPYYPLAIGNYWQFRTSPFDSSYFFDVITRDTLMPNGLHYSIHSNGLWMYERQDRNKIFEYDPNTNTENMCYDFSLIPNQIVNVFPFDLDTCAITFCETGYNYIFGSSRRQWFFNIDFGINTSDDEVYVEITDSIGVTAFGIIIWGPRVMEANIDGIQYGTSTKINFSDYTPPSIFALGQNYPNPFNPTTTIPFGINQSTWVILKVYDILGNEITTLINQFMEIGSYHIPFTPSELSSGIYFYRIQTSRGILQNKLILLR
jgi:hypothetical protein